MAEATTPKKRTTAKRTAAKRTDQAPHRRRPLDERAQGRDHPRRQPHQGRREDHAHGCQDARHRRRPTRDAAVSTGRSAVLLAGNYAERVAYVQVGAVLTARDTATTTIEDLRGRVSDRESAEKELREAREARRGRPRPRHARGQEGPHARRA